MTGTWSSGADRGKGRGGKGAAVITSFSRTSQDRDPKAGPRVCPLWGQRVTLGGFGNLGQSSTASLDGTRIGAEEPLSAGTTATSIL